jgi:hypothetical protein
MIIEMTWVRYTYSPDFSRAKISYHVRIINSPFTWMRNDFRPCNFGVLKILSLIFAHLPFVSTLF